MSRMQVGFAGLGTMGGGMYRRLADRGFDVVAFDLNAELVRAAGEYPGVTGAADVSQLAAPVVITMLPDGAAVRWTAERLLPRMASGSLIIDTGSSAPAETLALAELVGGHGVSVVDAPVSGDPAAARSGGLTLMAAGTSAAVDQAEAVLTALGRVFRVGPGGAGHALKALNNLLASINLAAAAEAVLAGRAYGLEPGIMLSVINASSGRSQATLAKLPDHVLSGTFDSGFALGLMLKDIRTATALLDRAGGESSLGHASRRLWEKAQADLPATADHTEFVRWLEGAAGVPDI